MRVPDVDDVIVVAEAYGFHLGRDEASLYRDRIVEQLVDLEDFLAQRDEGPGVQRPAAPRAPGHRPSAAEDPFNAWLWRCEISSDAEGVLSGKRVSFKDSIAVAGVPLTFGCALLEGFVPDFDATVVARVLDAGGTIVGKNAMDGFAGGRGFGGGIGDYGRTRNPVDPERMTGGSSSGSAVAVSVGDVDVSFGGDQGGSIRIPAAWTGVLGLKPTFGLVSHYGVGFRGDQSFDYTGPLARTASDAAAALQAVAGYDGLDPRQSRAVPERFDALSSLTDGVAGMRIGLLDEGFAAADPGVCDGVVAAVDLLAAAGATAVKVSVPALTVAARAASALGYEGDRATQLTGIGGVHARTRYPESLVAAVNRVWFHDAGVLSPRSKLSVLVAEFSRQNFYGRVYARAQNMRPAIIAAFDHALADVDVLVMPTCPITAPAFTSRTDPLQRIEEHLDGVSGVARNTLPFNYTGHPALAVPCGTVNGLPNSIQLVGRFFDDALLLQVAQTLGPLQPRQR